MTTDPSAARTYSAIKYRLFLAEMVLSAAVLAGWHWAGGSSALAAWVRSHAAAEPLVILGYLAVFGAVQYTIELPLKFYGSFLLEHRFGLSRMRPGQWVIRELKHLAVGSTIALLLIEGFYAILRRAPAHWPVWATIGWVGMSIVLARIFPTVLLPMFYKTTPLHDASLVERLSALCRRAGLPVLGVFRFQLGAETRKANAALAGLGGSRRVLLADTLLEQFSPEEIEGVLAHEVAHHRFRHITKMLILSTFGSWLAFTLTARAIPRIADIAQFPVLALWLMGLGLLGLPLQQGISRHFEWEADRFAVGMTPPSAFAGALRRLAALNLADPQPPRWIVWLLYDHPPITARIAAAEAAARSS